MRDLRTIGVLASSTLVKALAGLATAKILATTMSIGQFGQLSQLMALVAFAGMFAAGGISSGVTRVIASSKGTLLERDWLTVIAKLYLWTSVAIGMALVLSCGPLSTLIFKSSDFRWAICLLGVTQAIVGFGSIYQAYASAYANYTVILGANFAGAVAGTALLLLFAHNHNYRSAAVGLVLVPAMPGLFLLATRLSNLIKNVEIRGRALDVPKAGHLLSFSIAALAGAASITLGQMGTRDLVGHAVGWGAVGYWQATIRISDVYMQFVSVFLLSYAMPKLAGLDEGAVHRGFISIQKTLLALYLTGGLFIWLIRNQLYKILYSADFVAASHLLLPQLAGDLFRVVAAGISTLFMARGIVRVSITYESLQGVLLFTGTALLVSRYGGNAPVYAYGIGYMILGISMMIIYYMQFGTSRPAAT